MGARKECLAVTVAAVAVGCGGGVATDPSSTGSLRVSVSTHGPDPDPDGYLLTVAGRSEGRPLGIDGTLTVDRLPPGSHRISLDEVAVNCPVEGGQARQIEVRAGQTTDVTFAVSCEAAGTIVFSSDRFGQSEIVTLKANGTELTRLTVEGSTDSWPQWSPDGARLAFLSGRSGGPDYWLMDDRGLIERRLTTGEDVRGFPEWSPDGGRLAFYTGGAEADISLIAADGTELRLLEPGTAASATLRLTWSPDGEWLAFTARVDDGDAGTRHTIFRIRADGTGRERLGRPGVDEFAPVWSPDGLAIAFVTGGSVATMAPDGSGRSVLTQGSLPRWSPDGEWLAFSSDRTGTFELYVVRRDGSDVRQLSLGGGGEPGWSSDGRVLVYQCGSDICAVRRDGGNPSQLTIHPGNDRRASFRP